MVSLQSMCWAALQMDTSNARRRQLGCRDLLMPVAVKESAVIVMAPDRRRGLPLLAEPIHGDDPIPRFTRPDSLAKARFENGLVRGPNDFPVRLSQFVDVIADHPRLAGGTPLHFGHSVLFAQHDVLWLRRNGSAYGDGPLEFPRRL